MQTSIYIAKLMGPVIAVAGLGFMLNRSALVGMARDFLNSQGLIVASGFLALTMGLAVVNAHNIWVADWPVIITVIGWLAIVGGIVRVMMPDAARSIGHGMLSLERFMTIEAVLLTGLGAWLCYVGYLAS